MRKIKIITLALIAIFTSNVICGQSKKFEKFEKNTLKGTMFGVKNSVTNQEVIPAIYTFIGQCKSGKFVATKDNFQGVVDTLNKIIIPFKYSFVSDYLQNRVFLKTTEKLAMADENGKILTPFIYDDVLGYNDGVIKVIIKNKLGYINNQGKTILECKFDDGEDCKGEFIVVYSKSWDSLGWEFVTKDKNGKIINREGIGSTTNSPIVFNTLGKLLYKGSNGEKIIIPENKKIAISDKASSTEMSSQYVIIKSNGEKSKPIKFSDLEAKSHWILLKEEFQTGWEYGIMNYSGEIVLQPRFKSISEYKYNNYQYAKVEFKNNDFFYIDKNANCVKFDNKNCPE